MLQDVSQISWSVSCNLVLAPPTMVHNLVISTTKLLVQKLITHLPHHLKLFQFRLQLDFVSHQSCNPIWPLQFGYSNFMNKTWDIILTPNLVKEMDRLKWLPLDQIGSFFHIFKGHYKTKGIHSGYQIMQMCHCSGQAVQILVGELVRKHSFKIIMQYKNFYTIGCFEIM